MRPPLPGEVVVGAATGSHLQQVMIDTARLSQVLPTLLSVNGANAIQIAVNSIMNKFEEERPGVGRVVRESVMPLALNHLPTLIGILEGVNKKFHLRVEQRFDAHDERIKHNIQLHCLDNIIRCDNRPYPQDAVAHFDKYHPDNNKNTVSQYPEQSMRVTSLIHQILREAGYSQNYIDNRLRFNHWDVFYRMHTLLGCTGILWQRHISRHLFADEWEGYCRLATNGCLSEDGTYGFSHLAHAKLLVGTLIIESAAANNYRNTHSGASQHGVGLAIKPCSKCKCVPRCESVEKCY